MNCFWIRSTHSKNYKGSTKDVDIAKVMGFESKDEYNEIMFLREIATVNAFNNYGRCYGSIQRNRKRQNKGLQIFYPKLCMTILNRYSKATGVVIQ